MGGGYVGEMATLVLRTMAKLVDMGQLVALLLATAALWVRIQTSLKSTKWPT